MAKLIKKKFVATGLCALAIMSSLSMTSLAATDDDEDEKEKVGAITLTLSAEYDSDDELDDSAFDVETSTDGVIVSSFELDENSATGEDGTLSKYDTPVMTIYLEADDNFYFDKCAKGTFKLEGDDATYVSAKRNSDKTEITLKVKFDSIDGDIGNVTGVYWSGMTTATWTKGLSNKKYNLKLYKDDTKAAEYTTTNTSWDFANDMKEVGVYYFEVQGASSSDTSDFIASEKVTINDIQANDNANKVVDNTKSTSTSSSTSTASEPGLASSTASVDGGPGVTGQQVAMSTVNTGEWQHDETGWWFKRVDGSYPVNAWEQVGGVWYHFDPAGYMQTGIIGVDNKYYYLSESGAMVIGWAQVGSVWNYFDTDGSRVSGGWRQVNGAWYYLEADGSMATGWKQLGSDRFYLLDSGAMATGSVQIGNMAYYFSETGRLVTETPAVAVYN